MIEMDQYELVRTAHRVYKKSIRQIARETRHTKNNPQGVAGFVTEVPDRAPSPGDRTGVVGGASGVLPVRSSAFQHACPDGSVHKFRAADSAWYCREARARLIGHVNGAFDKLGLFCLYCLDGSSLQEIDHGITQTWHFGIARERTFARRDDSRSVARAGHALCHPDAHERGHVLRRRGAAGL